MNMALIKSKGNKSTEGRFTDALRKAGVSGWSVRPDWIEGRPDLAFADSKVAIFLDGCFWHGCVDHYRRPKTRSAYWAKKIRANRARDAKVLDRLIADDWKVFHVWEHDIADTNTLAGIILRVARAADMPDHLDAEPLLLRQTRWLRAEEPIRRSREEN